MAIGKKQKGPVGDYRAFSLGDHWQVNEYAKSISRKIDQAISIKESQITVLKEYKTTMINAAVTGKITVTAGQQAG